MAHFQYRGRDGQGALVHGELEADSENAAAGHLLGRQIIPLEITQVQPREDVLEALRKRFEAGRPKLTDLIFFTRQMHSLLHAGVPILDTLRGLRDTTPNKNLAEVIGAIHESLNAGNSLSDAFRQHPRIFPPLYVNIIEIGETSGSLAESFSRLVIYLEQENDTKNRIRAAIRYPKIVMGVVLLAVVVINLFVIPAFSKMFDRFNAELPLPTRILMATSNFTINYWYILLIGSAGLIFWSKRYLATADGRLWWDRAKLKIPIIGSILFRASLGRFAYALAICIKTGVPWAQSMNVVSEALDNTYLAGKIHMMREGVERGDTITNTATATGLFPPLVLQMINVGEQSGSIDRQLTEVAQFYEREVDYQLKNLSTNIEPFLLIVVGIIVTILALGIFMPMWGLASAALGSR